MDIKILSDMYQIAVSASRKAKEFLYLVPTFIVPIITIYIAYQQWRTNALKVKQDLFDRRFTLFNDTLRFLLIVRENGKPSDAQLLEFSARINEAYFLFGEDLRLYLEEISKNALELREIRQQLDNRFAQIKEGQLEERLAKQEELFDWFANQVKLGVARQKFSKHLELGKAR